MEAPPTLLSKARDAARVAAPLAFGSLLFGTDVGRRLGVSPDRIWDRHVADRLGDDGPWHSVRPRRGRPDDAKAWLFVGAILAYAGLRELKRYDLETLGPAKRVETDPIAGDGGDHDHDHAGGGTDGADDGAEVVTDAGHCTVCGTEIADGERRRYAEQWVLFGIPLWNRDYGRNDYCAECAAPEPEEGPVPAEADVAPTRTERNLGDEEVGDRASGDAGAAGRPPADATGTRDGAAGRDEGTVDAPGGTAEGGDRPEADRERELDRETSD